MAATSGTTTPGVVLPSFSGHETFALRHAWLKKGFDAAARDSAVFGREDAIVRLGVGKNMVRSIRHWCLAARVLAEEPGSRGARVVPTEFGLRLLSDDGWDPYLEDDASLWLVHWNLASSGARAAAWYWAFNRFHEPSFTRETLEDGLTRSVRLMGWESVAQSSLHKDVDCFLHTYVARADLDDVLECPLATLGLVVQEADGQRYRFGNGPKPTLPAAVFAYALWSYWMANGRDRQSLEARDILGSEGSPALVFRLDEDSTLDYLEQAERESAGLYAFEDTPLVRRVVRRDSRTIDPLSLLERYYAAN